MGIDFIRLNFMDIDVMGMDFAVREASVWAWGLALTIVTAPVHLIILAIGCAIIWSKPKGTRSGCAIIFFGPPLVALAALAWGLFTDYLEDFRRKAAVEAWRRAEREAYLAAKQEVAPHRMGDEERLAALCKQAGHFIHRKATEVEGVFLMKSRPTREEDTQGLWAQGPYGHWEYRSLEGVYRKGKPTIPPGLASGYYIWAFAQEYSYVDAIDPKDGKRYRYTAFSHIPAEEQGRDRPQKHIAIERREVTPDMSLPRHGITWQDITEREDRERYWIAGSSLKVIDLENEETMGERIGYMMSPWREGRKEPDWGADDYMWCPSARHANMYVWSSPQSISIHFVIDVLKPKQFEIPMKEDPFAEK